MAVLLLYRYAPAQEVSREELQRQIALTGRLLQETSSETDKAFSELGLINRQVSLREQVLTSLESEITSLDAQIAGTDELICAMGEDIAQLKINYARTARITYQTLGTDQAWLSILGAGTLLEAFYRAQYFRQFSLYRQRQIQLIRQTQAYLTRKSEDLRTAMQEKSRLVSERQTEFQRIDAGRKTQKELYNALRSKVNAYRMVLEEQKTQLKRMIRETESTTVSVPETEASVSAAAGFDRNRGKLPWPVTTAEGLIVGRFGRSEDAYGNPVTNDGIFIRTPEGQEVKAVFGGRVSGVQRIPLSGMMVIIEHGQYRTVYANLDNCRISSGQIVSAGQSLGIVRTDRRSGETLLNFLIYREPDQFLDPEKWLNIPR